MNKTQKRIAAVVAVIAAVAGVQLLTPNVISGNHTSTIVLNGHQYDGTVIDGAVIHDTGGDGITLRNVDNVIIRNCEIYGVSEGIAFSSLGTTNNTVIENCNIHDTGRNGIIVKQHALQGSNQTNVVIRNNTITRTGQSSTSGAYHGIYMQATDNVITGNTIDVSTGNGVSIRSSGTVSGNRISNTSKSCVRYFSDNATGSTEKLTIENNLCVNPPATYPGISLLWGGDLSVVTDYTIRFNTIIGGLNSIQVQSAQFAPYVVNVYGNLFNKSMVNDYIDYNAGNVLTTSPLNADYSLPVRYPVTVKDYPSVDIDGNVRTAVQLDAGAFAFTSSQAVPTFTNTLISPIETGTTVPTLTKTPTLSAPTATATLPPTRTPVPPTATATATLTNTPTPSATVTFTPTNTPVPTATPTIDGKCDPRYLPSGVCIYLLP